MKPTSNYVKKVGMVTLLSGLLAFACNILLALAVNFNFEAFSNPTLIFTDLKAHQVAFFRWGMITDLWGYYLLFAPAALYLYEKMESPWRHLFAASGIAYVVMGAIGAAILAAVGTDLLRECIHASQDLLFECKRNFLLVYSIVNDGIWNLLEMALFGIFMLGIVPVIQKFGKPLYYMTALLGFAGIIDAIGHTFEWTVLAEIGLNTYLLLAPVWAIGLGIMWMRGTRQP